MEGEKRKGVVKCTQIGGGTSFFLSLSLSLSFFLSFSHFISITRLQKLKSRLDNVTNE